jgi:hypothetical protein
VSCSSWVRRMVCGMGAISRSEVMFRVPDRAIIQSMSLIAGHIWNWNGLSVKTGPYLSILWGGCQGQIASHSDWNLLLFNSEGRTYSFIVFFHLYCTTIHEKGLQTQYDLQVFWEERCNSDIRVQQFVTTGWSRPAYFCKTIFNNSFFTKLDVFGFCTVVCAIYFTSSSQK